MRLRRVDRARTPLWARFEGLRLTAAGDFGGRYSYGRYWHGYQVILRPLLLALSYPEIRYFNMLMFLGLCTCVVLLVYQRIGMGSVVAFTLAMTLGGFIVVPMSLQFSAVTYLSSLGVIAVLALDERRLFKKLTPSCFWCSEHWRRISTC